MATGNAGSLVVSLALDAAQFADGLTKSQYQAKKFADDIKGTFENAVGAVEKLAAAVGIGFGVHAFADLIKESVEAEANLARIGARAGITGDQLSALEPAAKKSRTELESLAQMSARLSKALLESENPASKSAAVLKALGITSKDTARLLADPILAIQTIAKALNTLPETSGIKAGAQLLLLGRAGGTTSAALAEISKQGELFKLRTYEEVEAAKALDDKFADLAISSNEVKLAFGNALVPVLDEAVTALLKVTNETGGVREIIEGLARDGSIKAWAQDAVIFVTTVAESFLFLGRVIGAIVGSFQVVAAEIKTNLAATNAPSQKFTGSLGFTPEEAAAGEAEYKKALQHRDEVRAAADKNYVDLVRKDAAAVSTAIQAEFDKANSKVSTGQLFSDRSFQAKQDSANAAAKRVKDVLDQFAGKGDDPTRKILEAALAALKASSEQEKAVLENRDRYLTAIYDRGESSIQDYYAAKQAAQDEDLRKTQQNFEQEIVLIDRAIATAKTKQDKAAFEKQKADVTGRQNIFEIQAAGKAQQILDDQERALNRYHSTLSEVNATMLDLLGNTADAARIRFNNQNEDLRKRLAATITSPTTPGPEREAAILADQQLAAQQRLIVSQAKLTEGQRDYSNTLSALSIQQSYINLLQETGALTEIDALVKQSELAKGFAASLSAEADALQAVIDSGELFGPALDAAIIKVQQMRLEIQKLAATSDVLDKKFRDIFETNFADAITGLVTGTKTLRQALDDLTKGIVKGISDIASKNISESLFGKGGLAGGVPEFFGSLFGGKGAGDAIGKLFGTGTDTGLATASTAATTALVPFSLAVDTATVSLAALSAASGASTAASVGKSIGFFLPFPDLFSVGFAGGGTPPVGRASLVGERGPELFVPRTLGTIVPNHALRRGRSTAFNMTINVLPGASRQSSNQAAAAMGIEVRRAMARDT